MKPIFVRINKAIQFTIAYYTPHYIHEYMLAYTRMGKGLSSGSYMVDNWEELLYNLHNQMEDEILQTVNTANKNTQVIMFEELREWIEIDWRLKKEPDKDFFLKVSDEYNEKINSELEEKTEIEVQKFRSTYEFKNLGENEEYEKEISRTPLFMSISKYTFIPYKEKRINRKYYCNELLSEFIDYYQLPKYNDLVSRIINSFRNKVEKHLNLFDAGKYVPSSDITIQKEIIKNDVQEPKLLEATIQKNSKGGTKKLKVNLSVPQLVWLFKLLYEHNPSFFDVKTKGELYQFISDNFITIGSSESGISFDSIANMFPNPDKNAGKEWLSVFRQFITDIGKV